MDSISREIISQIVKPSGGAAPAAPESSTPMTIAQIVNPAGVYDGAERRAQGMLVAEIIAPAPAREQSALGI